jgi:Xaa-Pro aminopeptidase
MGADRRAERQAALVRQFAAAGCDALLVAGRANIRYLTGFSGSAGLLLVTPGEAVLATDFRYDEQAQGEARGAARVAIDRTSVWDRVFRELDAMAGAWTVGYESHLVTVRDAERLDQAAAGKRWRWAAAPDHVERLRMCKDADEVAAIGAAADVAEAAWDEVAPRLRAGRSERDIAADLEHALRRRGSEEHPFPTIVAAGERTALPHARASARPVRAGELLLADFGATLDGYCADLTRTVVVGRATPAQRALYDVVLTAQRRARAEIRAGMTGREADALARDVMAAHGLGDAFGHSTGHGLGLEVHEGPRVSKANGDPLPVGAVVTIEPGVYVAGTGGVRLEDDVHLAADGAVLLSRGAGELMEVG